MPVYEKHRTPTPRLHRTPQQRLESDAEDLQLLRRLHEGDDHAFWELWMKHAPRLFGLCLREMQGNRVDAEDALEEAMLRAHAKLPRFAAKIVAPSSWLARMTSNVCKDFYRQRTRGLTTVERFGVLQAELAEIPDALRSRNVLDDCDPAALAGMLPHDLREVFVLRFLQQTSYREIAARLGITRDTARKRVQFSRAILRAWRKGEREA